MFGRIFEEFETFEVTFEVYIEDKVVNKQVIQAPKQMLMMNYLQTMEQIGKDQRPMRLRMYRPETILDNFEQKERTITHEVLFDNNAMLSWRENKNEGNDDDR